jgi:hypothetical protein
MKRMLFLLIVCLMLCSSNANAGEKDIGNLDGHDWTEWQANAKVNFIGGFIAGAGHVIGQNIKVQDRMYDSPKAFQAYISFTSTKVAKPKETFSREEVSLVLGKSKEVFNNQLYTYNISGITNSQIVDSLNLLYSNFKNKGIKLVDAIYLMKRKIKGASSAEEEAILQYLRAGKDSDKLFYKDTDGEIKLISFP